MHLYFYFPGEEDLTKRFTYPSQLRHAISAAIQGRERAAKEGLDHPHLVRRRDTTYWVWERWRQGIATAQERRKGY
jgi:hypothetical protein